MRTHAGLTDLDTAAPRIAWQSSRSRWIHTALRAVPCGSSGTRVFRRPVITELTGDQVQGAVFTDYGLPVLNPENKSERRIWNEADMLVVFAD